MTVYERPAEPTTPPPVGTILVVQADGKGMPMVQPPTQALVDRMENGAGSEADRQGVLAVLEAEDEKGGKI